MDRRNFIKGSVGAGVLGLLGIGKGLLQKPAPGPILPRAAPIPVEVNMIVPNNWVTIGVDIGHQGYEATIVCWGYMA